MKNKFYIPSGAVQPFAYPRAKVTALSADGKEDLSFEGDVTHYDEFTGTMKLKVTDMTNPAVVSSTFEFVIHLVKIEKLSEGGLQ